LCSVSESIRCSRIHYSHVIYKIHDALRNKQTSRNAGPTESKNVTKMRTELIQKLTALRESYAATIGDHNLEQLEKFVPYPEESDGFNKWYGSYSDLYFRRPCIVKWGDGGLPICDLKFTMKTVKNKNKRSLRNLRKHLSFTSSS
jgi:hypothetical protein